MGVRARRKATFPRQIHQFWHNDVQLLCTLWYLRSDERLKLHRRTVAKLLNTFPIELNGGHTKVGSSGYCDKPLI